MNIKVSPQSADHETVISVVDDNTLVVDGEAYSFPTDIVQFDAAGPILEAHRDSTGALFVTVLRRYRGTGWPRWDDTLYHDYSAGAIE
jgi:hypothetical protein